jgi:hypothetical protein
MVIKKSSCTGPHQQEPEQRLDLLVTLRIHAAEVLGVLGFEQATHHEAAFTQGAADIQQQAVDLTQDG